MKKIIIWILIALPICASALSKEQSVFKKYFNKPVVAKESNLAPGAKTRITKVCPSYFFVQEQTLLLQLVRVELAGTIGSNLVVRAIRHGGLSYDNKVSSGEGIIKIPDLREKAGLELKLLDNGKEIQSLKYDWAPAKQWKVYITSVSHLDLGYTNTTEKVFEKRNQITEMALDFMKKTDNWQEDAKYRWTMEGAWELKYFLEKHPERLPELQKRAQEGRLEVCAKLVHEHTETEGYEELFRDVYYSKLEAEPLLGASVLSIMHNDVDGITWGEVSALSSSGIKYFSFNPNSFYRGGNILHATKFPQAFYWQGPGPGELLTWRSKDAYTELPSGLLSSYLFEGYSKLFPALIELLSRYEQDGYVYDAIHLTRSGADKTGANDNALPRFELCETIKEWNEHFAYPRLISATPKMFFSYLENNFAEQIPKARGDMPDWWADGVITEAKWTAMSRDLHHLLYQTEALASIVSILEPSHQYPHKEINDAYYNNILFDEHTWGYMLNTAPQHKQIFNIKSSWLKNAHSQTFELQKSSFVELAKKIGGPEPGIIVFNPLSWKASYWNFDPEIMITGNIDISNDEYIAIDPETNREVIGVFISETNSGFSHLYFPANNIPALGYKKFKLVSSSQNAKSKTFLKAGNGALENHRFKLTFDNQKGLTSIYDKKLGRELIDTKAKYNFGYFIYRKQDFADITDVRKTGKPVISGMEGKKTFYMLSGKMALAMLSSNIPGKGSIVESYILYDEQDYIDMIFYYDDYKNKPGESRYFVFPFNVPEFEIWVETPYGKMKPYYEQLPGFAKFWAVSHNVELRSKSQGFTIIWSTKEAPMIEMGEITKKAGYYNQMIWPLWYRAGIYPWNPDKPIIYSEIMNNFQNTNFSPSQEGSMTFHYRITAIDNKDLDKAHRAGWELSVPAIAVLSQGGSGELPPVGSFAQVSPDNVMITAFKKAEDGDGYILRIYEVSGKPAQAHLEFPLFKLTDAWLTDGVEREKEKLAIKDNGISLELAGFEVKNVKAKLIPK